MVTYGTYVWNLSAQHNEYQWNNSKTSHQPEGYEYKQLKIIIL